MDKTFHSPLFWKNTFEPQVGTRSLMAVSQVTHLPGAKQVKVVKKKPDVVIVELGANDGLRGLNPKTLRRI